MLFPKSKQKLEGVWKGAKSLCCSQIATPGVSHLETHRVDRLLCGGACVLHWSMVYLKRFPESVGGKGTSPPHSVWSTLSMGFPPVAHLKVGSSGSGF